MRLGLMEKKLENASKDGDEKLDRLQQKLDDVTQDLKKKEKCEAEQQDHKYCARVVIFWWL